LERSEVRRVKAGSAGGRPPAEIRLQDLRKSFGDRKVLEGLSLEVRPSELVGLLGRSGSGKSVILKHIAGLLKPDSGAVTVAGVDMAGAPEDDLKRVRDRMGYLFQGSALLNSLTVFDNVALPLRERTSLKEEEVREEVRAKLELVGLSRDAEKYPSELSGGMKKRAGLARAIAGSRDIFLYDEPTAGLDPMGAASIGDLIRRLQEKVRATSILVSHDLEFVLGLSTRVAVLDSGRIRFTGSPEETRRSRDAAVREFFGKPAA
jgi:phospholipid/cholesterol/gamma-HCH transport system ATP-binding protein